MHPVFQVILAFVLVVICGMVIAFGPMNFTADYNAHVAVALGFIALMVGGPFAAGRLARRFGHGIEYDSLPGLALVIAVVLICGSIPLHAISLSGSVLGLLALAIDASAFMIVMGALFQTGRIRTTMHPALARRA